MRVADAKIAAGLREPSRSPAHSSFCLQAWESANVLDFQVYPSRDIDHFRRSAESGDGVRPKLVYSVRRQTETQRLGYK